MQASPAHTPPAALTPPRARLALPAWARRGHPIVRYERRHWLNSRGWRLVNRLLWGGALTFVLFPAACALLFNITATFQSAVELTLSLGGVFTLGLVATSTLALWLNSLTAGVLAATLIARERESQTWPFLRLTSLRSLDLVGGKLAALGYTLARPVQLIIGLRLLAVISGLATAGMALALSSLTWQDVQDMAAALLLEAPLNPGDVLLTSLATGLGLLAALLLWLLEPLTSLLYNAAVGVAASTLARSRGTAVVLLVAVHFGLGLGVYAPVQQGAVLAVLFLPPNLIAAQPLLVTLLSAGLQSWLAVALWWAIVTGSLLFTLWRVERLGD
jgi:hypothetical protein